MTLKLLVDPGCETCERVENKMKKFTEEEHYKFLVVDICNVKESGIFIVPALLIDDNLYSYGDVDLPKLKNYIDRKS